MREWGVILRIVHAKEICIWNREIRVNTSRSHLLKFLSLIIGFYFSVGCNQNHFTEICTQRIHQQIYAAWNRDTSCDISIPKYRESFLLPYTIPVLFFVLKHSRIEILRFITNNLIRAFPYLQVQLYETFRTESRVYLVMEYASKGDLLEYINSRSGKTPGIGEAKSKNFFKQLLSGIQHCHRRNVVHR